MRSVFRPFLILAFGVAVFSCKKENAAKPSPPPIYRDTFGGGPYLYVGGFAGNEGICWKIALLKPGTNPVADTLAGSRYITSIVASTAPDTSILSSGGGLNPKLTSGGVVYMAGQTGGYYRNDSFVAIPGATAVQYLAMSGTSLYAAGFDNSGNPACWRNNSEGNLGNTISSTQFPYMGTSSLQISGLAASDYNVLISGSLFFENENSAPDSAPEGNFGLLWNNGSLAIYGSGALLGAAFPVTVGVAASGNDIYVAGTYPSNTGKADSGGYWKNGIWNLINNGAFIPASAAGFGTDIYIPGYIYTYSPTYSEQAAYWKNGNLVLLNGNAAIAITVYASDVYVLGVDRNNNFVVWKNGSLFETLGANVAWASCLAIG